MPSGSAAAGAGFRIVRTPAARAICSARTAASIGCSSCTMNTSALAISPAWASISAIEMLPATPGQTMIALLPVAASMKIYAAPV